MDDKLKIRTPPERVSPTRTILLVAALLLFAVACLALTTAPIG